MLNMTGFWPERIANHFDPFLFVMVMATGISANILHNFPYEARWLRYCSYPMFGLASLLFICLQLLQALHMILYIRRKSFKNYFDEYFRSTTHNVFWGTYPMGLITILNYIVALTNNEVKSLKIGRRLMMLVYVLWWYDVIVCLLCAWGISFLIWQRFNTSINGSDYRSLNEKVSRENLNCVLVLLIVPMFVASSSSSNFVMTDLFAALFDRNIQLMVLTITALIWLHALIFILIVITIVFWSLYVNKIPPMRQIFTMFLLLGPMGQASYGILLLTEDVRKYVAEYYPVPTTVSDETILLLAIPWCFKIVGLLLALALLAMGYFFTVIGFLSLLSCCRRTAEIEQNGQLRVVRLYSFHRGWFAMTFPMGTMSLGSTFVWQHYNQFVPLLTFRVLGAIYGAICIIWTITCITGVLCTSILPRITPFGMFMNHDDSRTEMSTVNSKEDRSMQPSRFSFDP